jgi:hypothetical protein
MAKKYWDGEYNFNTDWGGDESTSGAPLTGKMVQTLIKDKIHELEGQKVGYIFENTTENKVYFSATKEDYDSGKYMGSVSSEPIYSMEVKNDENNKSIFLSSDAKKEFSWYFKTIFIASNSVEQENVTVEYQIKNETDNVTKLYSTTIECNSDSKNEGYTKVTLNLDDYITNGTSLITINVKGLKTKQERTLQTRISIITLEMEDVTNFSSLSTVNFIVSTNVTCTKGQNYVYEYRIDEIGDFIIDEANSKVGKGTREKVDYYVNLADISVGKHIFEYRLFVKLDESTEPYYTDVQRLEFIKGDSTTKFNEPQIMIFSTYGSNEKVKADDGNLIINGISQYIPYTMKYAIYNSNGGSCNVEFIEVIDGKDSAPITDTVSNNTFAEYNIQSIESGIKTIKIITKDVDGNITNGDGRIVYLNIEQSNLSIGVYDTNLRIDFSSVGKSNNSVDKDSWISIVKGGLFKNNATFNEGFDWSQGWTDNGLVVSEGCEVIFDYAPFPMQKSQASTEESNEYVGGDKAYTFEIEFMTQNVTNEDAVVCDMMDETVGGNCGLQITGSQIKFTTPGGNSVSTRFKAEEMNRATIIIRPRTNSKGVFKGLVELYVNGVLSNITKYTEKDKFEVIGKDSEGRAVSKNLTFKGTEGADIVVKYIRAYNGTMEADDVVNNYIIYRTNAKDMLNLYNKNNVINDEGIITPETMAKIGNIPMIIFIGRTNADELASGDGNTGDGEGNCDEEYKPGRIDANEENWYQTLENTTNKKKNIDMDVIYYNPLDKSKNFKFVKAYITPQGTSSMYYPKKNYRIYTQKNEDTRVFLSDTDAGVLELDQMLVPNFGEREEDRKYEKWRGTKNFKKRKYSFKDNAQAVKCWCLKADFAETSSSHNTGIARLWGDTLKNSNVTINDKQVSVFKTNAQSTTEANYNNNINGDMPDVRTTIDGFPIVVFGAKSYSDELVFLGQYNFNNDKSTESVFGFCDIDDKKILTDQGKNTDTQEESEVKHTLDEMLDKYMTCVETLDNGNVLANFSNLDDWEKTFVDEDGEEYKGWENAFEFRYPEIPEAPSIKDYQDDNENWLPADKDGKTGEDRYYEDLDEFNNVTYPYWENIHLKPFKHFAQWLYETRWCDVNGNILPGLTKEEALRRKEKFAKEKWDHLDVWKMAAYYIYAMRFGAVDQVVKNSMLTSEGPFAYGIEGGKIGYWDTTDVTSENYGKYYKWYYINYDNDTIMGVKNDGNLVYGPEINRKSVEGVNKNPIYAGSTSTLWNNFDTDKEFQNIVRIADQGISKTMTYKKAIEMFDVEQVGKWCERIYNKDADYKYVSPYVADWEYKGEDEKAENFTNKLFMLQGSRTAHRRWWLSKRFNLFDGKWASGDFATKYVEVKCDYGSIGDTFGAVAGANAYFGYQINNKTFSPNEGEPEYMGGETTEFNANDRINWKLYKNIQIGDPIGIFGSTDMLELNLMGLSKNLSSVLFYFGNNTDISNKLERFIISVPDDLLIANSSYKTYTDDEQGTVNGKTAFEKLKLDYPSLNESDFENLTYDSELDASDINSPTFYRIGVENEEGDIVYTYFAKVTGGIRNSSCKDIAFDSLDKLQVLKMAGYAGINSLDLTKNKFINTVDVRYTDNLGTVEFAEGARIKEFFASTGLTTLSFTRCNNIKLSNIMINATSLKDNGGIYLNKILIDNSDGLNHDNDFKTFVLKWMKGGVSFKDDSDRSLSLKGIKWTGVSIKDIETILTFKSKAPLCELSGIIEMSNENISKVNMEKIESLKGMPGIDLTVKIPANILIECPEYIVAGKDTKIGCTLYPSVESIVESNGVVEYKFVKEVKDTSSSDVLSDANTGKNYIPISVSEIRENTVRLRPDNSMGTIIDSDEVILGEDTQTLIAAILSINGITKFDVVPLVIKDPTYAIKGSIGGMVSLNDKDKTFEYKLSLTSNKNEEPIGTLDIEWSLSSEGISENYENGLEFISYSGVSEDKKTLIIKTDSEKTPEQVANFNIIVNVDNYNSRYQDLVIKKEISILNDNIIMTKATNPVTMAVCYNNGLSAVAEYMTKDEAKNVTNIGTIFSNQTEENWSFDEFVYFTNPDLLMLDDGAFKGSNLTSITLPNNITYIGTSVFEGCKELETVNLSENLSILPEKTFWGCSSLKDLYLPDNINTIEKYALGGVGFEMIAFKNVKPITHKVMFIDENAKLHTIANDAFEETGWKNSGTTIVSTNKLKEVSLPKSLALAAGKYNFLLTPYLEKINLVSDKDSTNLLFENNILFADKGGEVLVRALCNTTSDNIVDTVYLPGTTQVFNYAFYNCKTIENVVFGNAIARYGLGDGVFYQSNIKTVDLTQAKTLSRLNAYSFYDCKELTSVLLPQDGELYTLGERLFYNSSKLVELILPDTISECLIDSFTTNNAAHTIARCGIKEFKFPENLLNVPMYFMQGCNDLEKVIFSKYFNLDKDKGGKYNIIDSCTKINTLVLPLFSTTVKEDSYYILRDGRVVAGPFTTLADAHNAFDKLENINEVVNGSNKTIHEIKEYKTGDVIVANAGVFWRGRYETFQGCNKIINYQFNEDEDNQIIFADTIDENNVALYRKANVVVNTNSTSIIPLGYNILERVSRDLSSYTILDNTKVINGAFSRCRKLVSFTVPEFVERFEGNGVFYECDNLIKVVLPENLTSLGEFVFHGCSLLTSVEMPKNISELGQYAFAQCKSLVNVSLPNTLTKMNEGVFSGCTALKEVVVPETVTKLDKNVFIQCADLEKVEFLSENIESIDQFALCGCMKLNKLLFRNINAPDLLTGKEYYVPYIGENKYPKIFKFHPFGYDESTIVGLSVPESKEKVLYLPYKHNGYNAEEWIRPLLTSGYSGFEVRYITLNNKATITGEALTGKDIIYLKSESGDFINNGKVESSTPINGVFNILFNNKVYDNETIYIYAEESCTTLLGSFVAKYEKTEYNLNEVVYGNTSTKTKTNMFDSNANNGEEMANITKREYEILQSKINQLMKLL